MTTQGFGGLDVTGGSANLHVTGDAVELGGSNVELASVDVDWTAIAAATHGEASVSAAPTTGRLTLEPGVYLVTATLSLENNVTSGESSEDPTNVDILAIYVAKGGTEVSGCRQEVGLAEGLPAACAIVCVVEVSKDDKDADTNYVSLKAVAANGGDTSVDAILKEAQFTAVRLA